MQDVLLNLAEGLLCMAVTGGTLVLFLVLVKRRSHAAATDHIVATQSRWPFWKGVMISAAIGVLLCGVGALLSYSSTSSTGSTDSIGSGLLTFCGVLTFFFGVWVSWRRSRF